MTTTEMTKQEVAYKIINNSSYSEEVKDRAMYYLASRPSTQGNTSKLSGHGLGLNLLRKAYEQVKLDSDGIETVSYDNNRDDINQSNDDNIGDIKNLYRSFLTKFGHDIAITKIKQRYSIN